MHIYENFYSIEAAEKHCMWHLMTFKLWIFSFSLPSTHAPLRSYQTYLIRMNEWMNLNTSYERCVPCEKIEWLLGLIDWSELFRRFAGYFSAIFAWWANRNALFWQFQLLNWLYRVTFCMNCIHYCGKSKSDCSWLRRHCWPPLPHELYAAVKKGKAKINYNSLRMEVNHRKKSQPKAGLFSGLCIHLHLWPALFFSLDFLISFRKYWEITQSHSILRSKNEKWTHTASCFFSQSVFLLSFALNSVVSSLIAKGIVLKIWSHKTQQYVCT